MCATMLGANHGLVSFASLVMGVGVVKEQCLENNFFNEFSVILHYFSFKL